MGTTAGRINGTTGAIPLTISLARIVLSGVLRGLRTTSARDHDTVASVESIRPQKSAYFTRFLNAREISRSISRRLIVSRLSKAFFPFARASSTLTQDPLK